MNFIDFVQFVKTQCMHETIYEDSNDNLILVTRMLDAYAMANKMVEAEREACAQFIETGYVRQFENPWRDDLSAAIRARGQA